MSALVELGKIFYQKKKKMSEGVCGHGGAGEGILGGDGGDIC